MTMRLKNAVLAAAIGVAVIAAAGCDRKDKTPVAVESVDISAALPAAKVKALLAGNTWEFVQTRDGKTVRRFYAKDGTFVPPGKTGGPKDSKGRWRVNEKGQECVHLPGADKERCLYIIGTEQEGYLRASNAGAVVSKVVSITPGNPDKL